MTTALEKIESKLTWIEDTNWPKRDIVEHGVIVTRDVANAFLAVYQGVRGTPEQQAEVGQAFKEAYIKHIAPLDLPVGPVIESFIDNYLPNLLAGLVPQLDAWLDTKLPNPVPPATT